MINAQPEPEPTSEELTRLKEELQRLRARYRREKRLLDQELERDLLAVEVMEEDGEYEGRGPWLTPEDD